MEQKRFDKKNLIVLAAVLLLIVVVAVVAITQRKELAPVTEDAKAYLVIEVAGKPYEPMLLEREGRFTITQGDKVNVVAVTKDGVTMHSSTCDNQDCVLQGTVSLANRNDRVLQNMILCLPNEVALYLCTEAEVAEMLLNMVGYPLEENADE